MLPRLLWKSVRGRKSRIALASAAVAVAAALASALLSVALDISEKVARELRAFGANIVVAPKQDASRWRSAVCATRRRPRRSTWRNPTSRS